MLLKYLNELESAVQEALASPDPAHYQQCLECVSRLEEYLQSQLEPVREKGFELMGALLPSDLRDRQPTPPQNHQ